jgi:hypothetical protein
MKKLFGLLALITSLAFIGCNDGNLATDSEPLADSDPSTDSEPLADSAYFDGHLGTGTLSFKNVAYEVRDPTWLVLTLDASGCDEHFGYNYSVAFFVEQVWKTVPISDGKFSINITGADMARLFVVMPLTDEGSGLNGELSQKNLQDSIFNKWRAGGTVIPNPADKYFLQLRMMIRPLPRFGGGLYIKAKTVTDAYGIITEKHRIDYFYVDANVTITASGNAQAEAFTLTLKPGWNAIHQWRMLPTGKYHAKVEDTDDFPWVYENLNWW